MIRLRGIECLKFKLLIASVSPNTLMVYDNPSLSSSVVENGLSFVDISFRPAGSFGFSSINLGLGLSSFPIV